MVTPEQRAAFLKVLARTGKVEHAAQRAGIPRSTAYAHRKVDAEFARQWDDATGRRTARAPAVERIPVELLTAEQRRLARALLDSLNACPPGSTPSLAQAALERWLHGQAWPPLDDAVVQELRRISPRAHADYEASRVIVAPRADDVPPVLGEDSTRQQ